MLTIEWLQQYDFARQAFVAAIAVGTLCSLLSVIVVLKRMAFIGQGVSHAGFGGIGLALFFGIGEGFAQDGLVLAFCLIVALVIGWLSRRRIVETDTAIGVLLVAAMSLGVLLTTLRTQAWYVNWMGPQPRVSIESLLFGSINNVGADGMQLAVGAAVVVLAACGLLFKEILFYAFDETASRVFGVRTRMVHYLILAMLTVTVVVAMKLVGVVLVTALLVIPGAAALQLSARLSRVLAWSWAIGVSCTVGGLILSFELGDVPPGPLMVGLLCITFACVTAVRLAIRRLSS